MNTAAQALDVRAFNRFYTRRIGMLAPTLSGSGFTLPQARVLWELSHHAPASAAAFRRVCSMRCSLSASGQALTAWYILSSRPAP